LSLSRLEGLGDEAIGMALLCLNSWGRAMRETAEPGDMRIVVRDESWKQLRLGVEAVKSFDADLRLSRRDGDIQFAIAHKPSDLLTAGDAGSQATAIARDLLHLADTKILLGQDAAVADELEHLLGLGPIARDIVTDWARQTPGRALWVVGELMFKCATWLSPAEATLAWTNTRLEGALP
ncbi:MAG: ATP-binding protein, partial [Propionicimonas sp.]|nr:ATP-binding protein [Propionicimonas sp.]